ncbi:MAG: hypothetical protein ACTS6H_00250 [Candidatus Hodgkinia cicadicola]
MRSVERWGILFGRPMMRSWEGTLHGTAEVKLSAEVIATMFVCSTNDVWCCDGPKTTAEEVVVNWLMNRLMNEGSVGTLMLTCRTLMKWATEVNSTKFIRTNGSDDFER